MSPSGVKQDLIAHTHTQIICVMCRTRYDSGSETSQNPPLSSYEAYRKGQIGFFVFIFGNLGNPGNLGNLGNPFFEVEMFLFSTLDGVQIILVFLVILPLTDRWLGRVNSFGN